MAKTSCGGTLRGNDSCCTLINGFGQRQTYVGNITKIITPADCNHLETEDQI